MLFFNCLFNIVSILQAFWYTMESEGMTGPVFGSRDNWKGLGVFFDSFDNDAKVCTMVYSLWLYYGFLLWFFFGAFERI